MSYSLLLNTAAKASSRPRSCLLGMPTCPRIWRYALGRPLPRLVVDGARFANLVAAFGQAPFQRGHPPFQAWASLSRVRHRPAPPLMLSFEAGDAFALGDDLYSTRMCQALLRSCSLRVHCGVHGQVSAAPRALCRAHAFPVPHETSHAFITERTGRGALTRQGGVSPWKCAGSGCGHNRGTCTGAWPVRMPYACF